MSVYKDNLIEVVGGQSQYNIICTKYSENIQDDPNVSSFFAHKDLNGLASMQMDFLDAALLDLSPSEEESAMGRLALNHRTLWQMGLNEHHFEILKAHFVEALRDCWVEEKFVALFEKHYDSLRPFFRKNSLGCKDQINADRISLSSVQWRSTPSFNLRGMTDIQRT